MSSNNDPIETCKEIRKNNFSFNRYNRPARIFVLAAFLVPMIILYFTAPYDVKGEKDFANSPYGGYAVIIFLASMAIAAYFSKKADKFKISISQRFALYVFNTYDNISAYDRDTKLENYKIKASDELTDLISKVKEKINELDDKIKWIYPIVNRIEELANHLEQNVLQAINSGDQKLLPEIKAYLIKLMSYFLQPSELVLTELLTTQISYKGSDISKGTVRKITVKKTTLLNIGIFGLFFVSGGIVYYLATIMGIDKNFAFASGIGLAGALSSGYFVYLRR